MEHRWGQRLLLDLPAMVGNGERNAVARVCDASLSGAFIATAMRLPLWSRIEVRLIPMTTGTKTDAIPACVVRSQSDGLGIEWCEFAPDEIRNLFARLPSTVPAGHQEPDSANVRHLPRALG